MRRKRAVGEMVRTLPTLEGAEKLKKKHRIRCLLGFHQYDKDKERSYLIFEERGESFYRIENECIYCGKKHCKILSFPTGGGKR